MSAGRRAVRLAVAVAVAVVVAATSLTGCSRASGAGGGAGHGDRQVTVDLTVRYSKFTPATVRVPAGSYVRFVVRNLDPIPHELIVGDRATHDRHEHGTEPHHGERAGEVSVVAGATAETAVVFSEEGQVEFGCHLPGHWDYGMRGVVEVT